jgi:hypothetical protein
MTMRPQKISFMSHHMKFLLVLLILSGSCFVFPASQLAFAHTFSTSESAEFLSLVDQIRAETALVTMNLENNNDTNATLAQAHAEKASSLLDNDTLGEIRERNNRIADSLESGLKQLEGNVTSLASTASQGQQQMMPQDTIQSINQTVGSLNDTLAEAVTVRVETEQQNNATTWAMVLADLVNVVLSNYGNATGAPFDLTNMSNMAGMEMDASGNMTTMNEDQMQMSGNSSSSSSSNNTTTMTSNATTTSKMSNMTTTIVDASAYQSAQYLANNTILELFNDTLKPLTISTNASLANNNNSNNASMMTQQEQGGSSSTTTGNNMTSNLDKLEAGLLQLRDDINGKATPNEVMMTAHVNIHPLIMQIYGLTIEQEEGEEHSDHTEGQ